MNELTLLRKQTKAQLDVIREQEITIAEQQAEILRLKARVVSKRRIVRQEKEKKARA